MNKPLAIALITVASLSLAGCGDNTKSDAGSSATTTTAKSTATTGASSETTAASGATASTVKLTDSKFGKILTDGDGNTLYIFTPDTPTTSACNSGCSTAWPPLKGPAKGDGVDAEDLTTLTRDDGSTQV